MEQLALTARVEDCIRAIGNATSWLALVLVAIVCASVLLRYAFGVSSLAFDELQWHIYSGSWILGFSYATAQRTHVRNDILYNRYSEINQKRVDFYSHLVLVLPFAVIMSYHAWDFVAWSWQQNEGSIDPGGLPHRWVIKSILFAGLVLFGVAALARVIDLHREIKALKQIKRMRN